jgi:hypothetical protein
MPHYKFPSHCVYWTHVKDHENIKSIILPKIRRLTSENNYDNPFKLCKFTTDFSTGSEFLNDELIRKIIPEGLIQEMISETGSFSVMKPTCIHVTKKWFNVYEKGDFQEIHTHTDLPVMGANGKMLENMLSMIYILHEEEPSPIFFRMDNIVKPFCPLNCTIDFKTSNVDDIKEGTLIVFSSHLQHGVLPIKKTGRTTIAFNVACTFD